MLSDHAFFSFSFFFCFLNPHPRVCLLIFRKTGREREKEGKKGEREKNINVREIDVREKHGSVASHTCPDHASNPKLGLVDRTTLQPTEPLSQGFNFYLLILEREKG